MRRMVPALLGLVVGLGVALPLTAQASPTRTESTGSGSQVTITATSTGSGDYGVLTLSDNATALHHTRQVEYYDHDGYHKTAQLVTAATPLGVVLRQEDIDNNCGTYTAGGGVNPAHGDGSNCHPVLHPASPAATPHNGDLAGRYCRVPPPGFHLPCPFDVFRSETVSGSGRFLTVGDKDHGALTKVSYYTNVAGMNVEVTVVFPFPVEVTRIVLVPGGPSAVVALSP